MKSPLLLAGVLGLLAYHNTLFAETDAPVGFSNQSPQINGLVEGSLQTLSTNQLSLNSGATITGDLLVRGTPDVVLNGNPDFQGTILEGGSAAPSGWKIYLNSGSKLRNLRARVDGVAPAPVPAPPQPQGNRWVWLNPGQAPGDFATIRGLGLNSGYGPLTVPPGVYGEFTSNSNTAFILGNPDGDPANPDVYVFDRITINSNGAFHVAGPVRIILRWGANINGPGPLGNPANHAWLKLEVHSGGIYVNSGAEVFAHATAPASDVYVNGQWTGGLVANRITVNSGGALRLRDGSTGPPPEPNQPPVAEAISLEIDQRASVLIPFAATDPDGDDLEFLILSTPSHGSLADSAGEPLPLNTPLTPAQLASATYLPGPAFHGTDSFTYTATDGDLTSAPASVTILVRQINFPPAVVLGDPLSTLLPGGVELVPQSITDDGLPEPASLQYSWTFVSGPGEGVIENSHLPQATAWFASLGIYVLRLTVSDGELEGFDEIEVTVLAPNKAPAVDAGSDILLADPGQVTLTGSATDDGLPNSSTLAYHWRVVEGDASQVEFTDSVSPGTTANILSAGSYVLRLSVTDGDLFGTDELRITVVPANTAPVVQAGPDIEVPVGNRIVLQGSAVDDGLPAPAAFSAAWTVIAGDPEAVVFEDASSPTTPVRFLTEGTFILELRASDGVLDAADQLTVLVGSPTNDPPVVDAGQDQQLLLNGTLTLLGSVQDDGRPEGGALTHVWTQVDGPANAGITDASLLAPSVTFLENGEYRFRLTASDGELSAWDEVNVTVSTINQPPLVNAGDDFTVEEAFIALLRGTVSDDGLPVGSTLSVQWTSVSGPGDVEFQNATSPVTGITVTAHGTYALRLTANDGALDSHDDITITFGASSSHPPIVDAGPDQEIEFFLQRSANLLINPGAEEPAVSGVIPGWTQPLGAWDTTVGPTSSLPPASEGTRFFAPASTVAVSELRQVVDVSALVPSIDAGDQIFEFSVRYRTADKIRPDQPMIRIRFLDAVSTTLAQTEISPTAISTGWGLLADSRVAPTGTRFVQISLVAEKSGITTSNDVYFDNASLRALDLGGTQFQGVILDEGVGPDPILTSWRQIAGPVASIISFPADLDSPVFFGAPGVYEFALEADNGIAKSEDRMVIEVLDPDSTPFLSVDAGPDLSAELPLAIAEPIGQIGSLDPVAVSVSWTEVSGNDRLFIQNADTLTPTFQFYETGEYLLRLSATDGERVAYDEMRVTVDCPSEFVPLDVVLVIDASGSMGGERIVNAKLAAQQFISTLLFEDAVSVASFTSVGTIRINLTTDHAAAATAVDGIGGGGGTAINSGITAAAQVLSSQGRAGALPVIILLSDGGSSYSAAVSAAQSAHAAGFRLISVGLGAGTNENLMADIASSRADYFFAASGTDLPTLYDGLANSFCRYGTKLGVFAGGFQQIPNTSVPAHLTGSLSTTVSFFDEEISTVWEKVSGPGQVAFTAPDSLLTDAFFSEPGRYVFSLTATLSTQNSILASESSTLTVIVDNPTGPAPSGMTAFWKAEGNLLDSISNFHGSSNPSLRFETGMVDQALKLHPDASAIHIPTAGALNLGQSANGFTLEFWMNSDSTSGQQWLAGWFADNQPQFAIRKHSSSNRNLLVQWTDAAGTTRSYTTPNQTYTVGQWQLITLSYLPSTGQFSLFRDGLLLDTKSFPAGDIDTTGDFWIGGHSSGTSVFPGRMDEITLYDRVLDYHEIWSVYALADKGKIPPTSNTPPVVDAGPDITLGSMAETAHLTGFADDDGLPVGTMLRTQWSKISGPGDVLFQDPQSLSTTVSFSQPGIYTLQLQADDGVLLSTDSMTIRVDWNSRATVAPSGLAAHWPANGSGQEVIQGLNAAPAGNVQYIPGVVGDAFHYDRNSHLFAPTAGRLNVGDSPEGFTLEFWANFSNVSGLQSVAGWHDQFKPEFAVIRGSSTITRNFRVSWKNSSGITQFIDTAGNAYTFGQWHHYVFAYDRPASSLRLYRDGSLFSSHTLSQTEQIPTTGNFFIGSDSQFAQRLLGSLDEVSVYNHPLTSDEVWSLFAFGDQGKISSSGNLPPIVDAGSSISLSSILETAKLNGVVSDDGLPGTTPLVSSWSALVAPGIVSFTDLTSASTTATFSAPGIYVLELMANDGLAITRDTVRITVGWSDGAISPPDGLVAHWPGDATGHEIISGYDADMVGPVQFSPGRVGGAFDFNGQSYAVARTNASLDVGSSVDGFTVEFWSFITITSSFQNLFAWAAPDGTTNFVIRKNSSTSRTLSIGWTQDEGTFQSINTPNNTYSVNQWQHFAFAYDAVTGTSRLYRNGILLQSFSNIGPGGFPTTADIYLGGSPLHTMLLQGALDEVSIYDRVLLPGEVWGIYAAGEKGKIHSGPNLPPYVDAGADLNLPQGVLAAQLQGFVSDDGLPGTTPLRVVWSKLLGPGEVLFSDPSWPITSATFSESGIYVLQLLADDGLVVSRDTVRVSVDWSDGAIIPPDGLVAHWPGDGTGHEVISGYDADLVGPIEFIPGQVGGAFDFSGQSYSTARTDGTLDVGSSEDGFTVEFWSFITSTSGLQNLVAWATPDGSTNFAIRKNSSTNRTLSIGWTDHGGTFQFLNTPTNTYTINQWQHFAFTYDAVSGNSSLYRDGTLVHSFSNIGPGGFPTTGDIYLGGSPLHSLLLQGALDEVSIYNRPLTLAEVASIHAAGAHGKLQVPTNQPPTVLAGYDQSLADTLTFNLDGRLTDDGLPAGGSLTHAWSQLSGPAPAIITQPESLLTEVTAPTNGIYTFRLTATDGELSAHSDTTITLTTTVPPNTLPVVNVGPDLAITLPAPALLDATVSDPDGGPQPLALQWSTISGSGTVTFADPTSSSTQATFSAPGIYVLRLAANDGADTTFGQLTATVFPAILNAAPVVDAGPDINAEPWEIITLQGTATDDGLPGPLVLRWSKLTGPGHVIFETPTAATTRAQFDQTGTYTLQFRALDGEKEGIATMQVHVGTPVNRPPTVDAGGPLDAIVGTPVPFSPSISDDGLSLGYTTRSWRYSSGPGGAVLAQLPGGGFQATLNRIGQHVFTLEVFDGEFTVTDDLVIHATAPHRVGPSVALVEPAEGITLAAGASEILSAEAADPDGSISIVHFYANDQWIGSRTTGPVYRYTWNGIPSGTFALTAVAINEIGQSTTSAPVTLHVTEAPVGLRLAHPANGSLHPADSPVVLHAIGTGGAAITSVSFFRDGQPLGTTSTVPFTTTWQPDGSATATFTATATTVAGLALAAGPVTISLVGSGETDGYLEILFPEPGDVITAPTAILGTFTGDLLDTYTLQYRAIARECSDWQTFASGSAPVGEIDEPAPLGTFDPTLLLNGVYEIRLTATDLIGREWTTPPTSLVVDGGMKVGHFQVAFNDLEIPLAGMPVTITRTYDSRDLCPGDFGRGWNLDIDTIRLESSHPLTKGWVGDIQPPPTGNPNEIPVYSLVDDAAHRMSIRFPDGTTETFQPTLRIKATGQTSRAINPITIGTALEVAIVPDGNTTATLRPLGFPSTVYLMDGLQGRITLDTAPFEFATISEPSGWEMVTLDGRTLTFDAKGHLITMQDTNGNRLAYTRNTQGHVTAVVHTSPIDPENGGGTHVEQITLTRDAQGRVTQVTDPAGNDITYAYSPEGQLASVTDRAGDTVSFEHSPQSLLLDIHDPRGTRALRNEYDDQGRLTRTIDPDGKITAFTYNLTGRTQSITDRLGRTTTHEYDTRGNVTRITDPLGHTTTSTYDSRDNQLTETDPLGRTTTYSYNSRNLLTSLADPLGHATTFTYDPRGNLLTLTDPLGRSTHHTYDSKGNLKTITDAAGNITRHNYDAAGNRVREEDALGHITAYTYDSQGRMTRSVDPLGHATDYTYDANGNRLTETTTRTIEGGAVQTLVTIFEYDPADRLVATISPDGSRVSTPYNSIGQVASSIDPLGRATTFNYDAQGRQVRVTHPDGLFEDRAYDEEGRQIETRDRAGRDTTFEYDALGRLVKTVAPDGAETATVYDAAGRVIQSIDAFGNITAFEYDAAGRRTKVIDALGNETSQTYNAAGNLLTVTDALGRVTTHTYDQLNRRIRTTFEDGTFTSSEFDAIGRRIADIDQAGLRTEYGFDDLGRLVEVADAEGATTTYAYDEIGNQLSQTDALGRTTTYAYDRLGRRLSRTLPLGQFEHSQYDAAGNILQRIDFNGSTTTYSYDALNRILSQSPDLVAWPGAQPTEFTYTPTGQRATMSDSTGVTTYHYDNRDRLTSTITPQGGLDYSYDAAGNLISTTSTDPEGIAVTYTHDPLNRLATLTESNLGTTNYTYSPVGSLHHAVLPNGTTTTHQYDSLDRLVRRATTRGADLIADFQYSRGPAGHRTVATELIAPQSGPGAPAPLARTVAYTYDDVHRLVAETITAAASPLAGASSGPMGTISYAHDLVGNRLSRTSSVTGILSQVFTYDANDRLANQGYDANGNTLTGSPSDAAADTLESEYDFMNRLVRAVKADGTVVETMYNGDGQRVQESVTAGGITTLTSFLIDNLSPSGWPQVVEERINGTLAVTYTFGHDLIAQDRKDHGSGNWTASFYGYDGHGSVRLLTDALGQITDTVTYDAFGELLHTEGATTSNYLYAGQQFAPALGLYYNRARYLSSNHGRFWSMDAFEGYQNDPQSLHKYLYAHGDPVNGWDPSGFSFLSSLGALHIRSTMILNSMSPTIAYYYAIGAVSAAKGAQFVNNLAMQIVSRGNYLTAYEVPIRTAQGQQIGKHTLDLLIRRRVAGTDKWVNTLVEGKGVPWQLYFQAPNGWQNYLVQLGKQAEANSRAMRAAGQVINDRIIVFSSPVAQRLKPAMMEIEAVVSKHYNKIIWGEKAFEEWIKKN